VVVDVEGNGHQPPEVVGLAVAPSMGGVVGEPASWLVRPPHPSRHFATSVHGLTTANVADCPAIVGVAAHVLEALDAPAFVAHTACVDVDVLRREPDVNETPCDLGEPAATAGTGELGYGYLA
jgi:exodeoxyribonuclease X